MGISGIPGPCKTTTRHWPLAKIRDHYRESPCDVWGSPRSPGAVEGKLGGLRVSANVLGVLIIIIIVERPLLQRERERERGGGIERHTHTDRQAEEERGRVESVRTNDFSR